MPCAAQRRTRFTTRHLSVVIILAIAARIAAPAATTQDSPVVSAIARVERVGVSTLMVTLTNKRRSPLISWEVIATNEAGTNQVRGGQPVERLLSPLPDSASIEPGGTRTMRMPGVAMPGATARLAYAVFDDGYLDGDDDRVAEGRRWLELLSEDLAYWRLVLGGLPVTPNAARQYLKAKIDERSRVTRVDLSQVRGLLARWLASADEPFATRQMIDSLTADVNGRANRVDGWRQMATSAPRTSASVALASNVAPGEDLAVRIENRKDVPIVAFVWDEYWSSGAANISGGRNEVACSEIGQIVRERPRTFLLRAADGVAPGREPIGKLQLVVWADGTFEGLSMEHERYLRTRAARCGSSIAQDRK